jgi:hypothetical protein
MARDHTHPNEAKPHPDDDKYGDWSRLRLERMNDKFARAIVKDQRQPPSQDHGERETNKMTRGVPQNLFSIKGRPPPGSSARNLVKLAH